MSVNASLIHRYSSASRDILTSDFVNMKRKNWKQTMLRVPRITVPRIVFPKILRKHVVSGVGHVPTKFNLVKCIFHRVHGFHIYVRRLT